MDILGGSGSIAEWLGVNILGMKAISLVNEFAVGIVFGTLFYIIAFFVVGFIMYHLFFKLNPEQQKAHDEYIRELYGQVKNH